MKPMVATLCLAALLGTGVGSFFMLNRGGGDAPLLESPPIRPVAASNPAPVVASKPFAFAKVVPPTEKEKWAAERQRLYPGENDIPDPDGVGPCPPAEVANRAVDTRVHRRGLFQGLPTWWHEDGVFTQIAPMQVHGKDTYGYVVSGPQKPARVDMRIEDPSGGTGTVPAPGTTPPGGQPRRD